MNSKKIRSSELVNKKNNTREIRFFCDITKTWQTLIIKKG